MSPQTFAERALLQRNAYGGHQVGVLAERESRLEVLLQRVELQRVQPRGLGQRPRGLRQAKQGRPAPKGERLGDRVPGVTGIAGAERAARSCEQLLELDGVDHRPVERVPVGGEPDRVLAQRLAQPGHVVLHGVSRDGGKIAAPQRFDQRVRRDDTTRSQGQARHQRLPFGARHDHWLSRHGHFERPQEPNLELVQSLPSALARSLARQAGRCGSSYAKRFMPVRPEPCPELPPRRLGRPQQPRVGVAPFGRRRQRRATGWQLDGSKGTDRPRDDARYCTRTELGQCCRSPTGCAHAASRW